MKGVKRICIYPKDIMRITGRGERYSRRLAEKIKMRFCKTPDQLISISEFCLVTGLDTKQVEAVLTD